MASAESPTTQGSPAGEPDPLEPFRGRRTYLSLTSHRRDGTPVTTTVWCVVDETRILMRTDSDSFKVKRMRRNPSVTVAPCNFRGENRGEELPAQATELSDSDRKLVEKMMRRKYPIGLAVEVAFLRPIHALFARLGRGKRRGDPIVFGIVPEVRRRVSSALTVVMGFAAEVPESLEVLVLL